MVELIGAKNAVECLKSTIKQMFKALCFTFNICICKVVSWPSFLEQGCISTWKQAFYLTTNCATLAAIHMSPVYLCSSEILIMRLPHCMSCGRERHFITQKVVGQWIGPVRWFGMYCNGNTQTRISHKVSFTKRLLTGHYFLSLWVNVIPLNLIFSLMLGAEVARLAGPFCVQLHFFLPQSKNTCTHVNVTMNGCLSLSWYWV